MASSGPNSPGTLADDSSVGTVAWSNPSNGASSNNSYATAAFGTNGTSHYLKATNFGFAIPSTATIDGILVGIERSRTGIGGGSIKDSAVRIVKGGAIGSTNKGATGTAWPSADAYASYGGAADLWGESWTYSDINASNFGVAISAAMTIDETGNARVDHVRVTVYYTDSGGGGTAGPVLFHAHYMNQGMR